MPGSGQNVLLDYEEVTHLVNLGLKHFGSFGAESNHFVASHEDCQVGFVRLRRMLLIKGSTHRRTYTETKYDCKNSICFVHWRLWVGAVFVGHTDLVHVLQLEDLAGQILLQASLNGKRRSCCDYTNTQRYLFVVKESRINLKGFEYDWRRGRHIKSLHLLLLTRHLLYLILFDGLGRASLTLVLINVLLRDNTNKKHTIN